jgi:SSS family solute:Na+ symporter
MLVSIAGQMPDGYFAGLGRAWQAGKFSHGELQWDMARRTFWTLLFIGAFDAIANNASNQTVVQRYIAASSTREARQAVWIRLVASVLTWIFFYLVGTNSWALYTALAEATLAAMTFEEIVPHFVMNYLPVGITGLIIAAIMAAVMSSLDSRIKVVSTTATTDVVRRYLNKDAPEKNYLVIVKKISAVAVAVMIGLALIIHSFERESLVDLLNFVSGVMGGAVGGSS